MYRYMQTPRHMQSTQVQYSALFSLQTKRIRLSASSPPPVQRIDAPLAFCRAIAAYSPAYVLPLNQRHFSLSQPFYFILYFLPCITSLRPLAPVPAPCLDPSLPTATGRALIGRFVSQTPPGKNNPGSSSLRSSSLIMHPFATELPVC